MSKGDTMRVATVLLVIILAVSAVAADYPAVPLDKLLSTEEQESLGTASMSAAQQEVLRRALIDAFRAGFNKGKGEGAKNTAQARTASSPIESQIDGEFEGWEG